MYVVRPAQAADIPAILRLTELWAVEPSTTGHYPVNFAEDLQSRLGRYFWVAERDEEVVGFIIGSLNGDSARSLHYQALQNGEDHLSLDQLFLHPDHRRRGVGSQLVTRVFEEAASHGVHRHLVMSANADWQGTMRFYEKLGFRMWYFRMFTGPSTEERREVGRPSAGARARFPREQHPAPPPREARTAELPSAATKGRHPMASIASLKSNPPANRLRGSLPKIGIRPTIDGRYGGVRESLEGQVMAMARATAAFLTESLRHSSGLPVECVVADTCIGGVSEAAKCAGKFAREGVGVSLTVTPCWCYGSETMDMDPLVPKAIWGFNGTERPGAVYLAATLAGHSQKGLPAFGIYGRDVQDAGDTTIPPDVGQKLLQFARAGLAVATMRGASYLAMGGVSMGIAGSIVDQEFFQETLGMRAETVDMTEFVRRIEEGIYDREEYERALRWTRENCPEGPDVNPPAKQRSRAQKDADWEFCVKMTLIARDLMVGNPRLATLGYPEEAEGHNALAGGFQGQRQWTDHFPNGDFLEAILCTSFDWNGLRQPYVVATENDALNGVSMLFGHLLTGTAQLFSDVRTYWSPAAVQRVTGHALSGPTEGGIIHLINSGPSALDWTGEQSREGKPAVKPFWEITPEEAGNCLDATSWRVAVLEYFRGGGYSTDFLTRGGMPVTMCRVNLVKGLGPVLQIAEGWTVDLPEAVHRALDERTNPTWPTTWFVPNLTGHGPFADVYSVMNNWGANHGAISYGHIGGDLITLAALLRIPVDMHNVPAERVFRPSVWSRFGALEPQAADYRACAAFGPLYR